MLSTPIFGIAVVLAGLAAATLIAWRGSWRLAREPVRAHALAPEIGVALVLAMLLAGPVLMGIAQLVAGDVWKIPSEPSRADYVRAAGLTYAAQGAVAVLWIALVRRAAKDARAGAVAEGTPIVRERTPAPFPSVCRGLVALLLVWPIAATAGGAAAWIIEWLGGEPPQSVAHETLALLVEGPIDVTFVALSALVVIAAPLLEEVLYRGLIQSSFRAMGLAPWPAITAASVLFAAMHWSNTAPHAVVSLFVLSLGFGWAYERTKRLASPMAMHVTFNLVNLVVARALLGMC